MYGVWFHGRRAVVIILKQFMNNNAPEIDAINFGPIKHTCLSLMVRLLNVIKESWKASMFENSRVLRQL